MSTIKEARTSLLEVSLDRPFLAGGLYMVSSVPHVLLRLRDGDGTEGVSYLYTHSHLLIRSLRTLLEDMTALTVGEDPMDIEAIRAKLRLATNWGGPGGVVMAALATVDVALWDLKGKLLGQPLYRMLGGFRDRVPTYASGALWRNFSLKELQEAASRFVQQGFRAMKLRLGSEPSAEKEVERMRVVREAVGPDVDVMVDINQTWTPHQAVRIGRMLEEHNLYWLEDPVDHQDVRGSARVAHAITAPVTAGEYHWGMPPLRVLLENEAVDILMVDLMRVGGITDWMKAAGMAEGFRVPVASHICPEVLCHTVAAVPNGLTVEYMPWSFRILEEPPKVEKGMLVLPQHPGTGVRLDERAVKQYAVQ
ncbi:MAG: mandelate racemase/muconate lactonizing enzyme family protein [Chloroflexi bacterium]|nr:mandelate racemase/muconate lactonizing enzyme family protein [Chloroflexota bacterium]